MSDASESLRLLTKNERMSKSIVFVEQIAHSLIFDEQIPSPDVNKLTGFHLKNLAYWRIVNGLKPVPGPVFRLISSKVLFS